MSLKQDAITTLYLKRKTTILKSQTKQIGGRDIDSFSALSMILLYGRALGAKPQKLIVVIFFQRANWTGGRHLGTKEGSGAAVALLFET
jgi:hypothetical protein